MPSHGLPKIRALSAYDKTAINVRPDGSRIELDPKTSKAKARAEFQAKHRKQPVKTSRKGKTWIAADAYEFERIPKRRRVVQEESEESGVEKEKEKEVERKKKEPKRASAKRRRSNISDLSFLSNESVPRSAKHDTAGAGRIAHADLDPSSVRTSSASVQLGRNLTFFLVWFLGFTEMDSLLHESVLCCVWRDDQFRKGTSCVEEGQV